MVNTSAALVYGGHIVELKGWVPCSNCIVLSEVDNSKEKKNYLPIEFINNIDDNEMKYLPKGYNQSVKESENQISILGFFLLNSSFLHFSINFWCDFTS